VVKIHEYHPDHSVDNFNATVASYSIQHSSVLSTKLQAEHISLFISHVICTSGSLLSRLCISVFLSGMLFFAVGHTAWWSKPET